MLYEIFNCMESTTTMNRGEVEPTLEMIMDTLKYNFSNKTLRRHMPMISRYYELMVLREELDYKNWRLERGLED